MAIQSGHVVANFDLNNLSTDAYPEQIRDGLDHRCVHSSFLSWCAIVAMVLWAGLVFMGTLNGWGRKPLAPAGNANAFMEAARKEIAAKHRGNAAFRLIEKGKLHDDISFRLETPLIAKRCFKSLL